MGQIKLRTTNFSKRRESMKVTDMERKSEQVAGSGILATGVSALVFGCSGTTYQGKDRLIRIVIIDAVIQAVHAALRTQDGRPSIPAAIDYVCIQGFVLLITVLNYQVWILTALSLEQSHAEIVSWPRNSRTSYTP